MSRDSVPDPSALHPTSRPDLTGVVFLAAEVSSELISVGQFSYYDNEGRPGSFEQECVRYLYGPQRLIIGSFSTIGPGVEFLMPGGNHPMVGPSTYPFTMFGGAWAEATLDAFMTIEQPGDTVVGNDVWIGREAMILPGITIGDGAVIGARSVVTQDVAPYSVVAGNPARLVRNRYEPHDVTVLQQVAWWNWPLAVITTHAATIMTGQPAQLRAIAAAL